MDWKEKYSQNIVTAEEAVKHIKSGDRVVVGHATGEPSILIDAMVANKEQYENVEIVHFVAMGKSEYCKPGMEKHFIHNSFFIGKSTRDSINNGQGLYSPTHLSQIGSLFSNEVPVDVALFQVSTPDENGNCSYGISVDFTKIAADNAKIKIAEINEQYPYTYGDSIINIADIDFIVPTSNPVIEISAAKISDVEAAIGKNCASLIEDGSTLQLGIGGIPDAVLASLGDIKDLGIHTEMLPTGVVDLIEKGKINCSKKTLHPGKVVATFVMGSKKLYDFVDHNKMVELYPCDYVNDPYVISQNEKMVSINSCIEIDFSGQVCSESIGPKQISGTGGQVDFIRGATMSKGGKAIIAITSTANNGKVSRIVPFLSQGSVVTTLRTDVNYVVTEYGIAQLRGKSTRDRARALINIAHPKFRDELIEKFVDVFKCKF